jgi:3-oxoacid CoA-transferase subunit A
MSINKVLSSFDEAIADIDDGATVAIGGAQGPIGIPNNLILALQRKNVKDLTVIGITHGRYEVTQAGHHAGWFDLGVLIKNRQVKKLITGLAFLPGSNSVVQDLYESGDLELEHIGHGNLTACLYAAAAGFGGLFTPTGIGTILESHFTKQNIDGRDFLILPALKPDFSLVWAKQADSSGNLVYQGTSRQLNPVMARAGGTTIAEVDEVVEFVDPENVEVPGVYVDRVVPRGRS